MVITIFFTACRLDVYTINMNVINYWQYIYDEKRQFKNEHTFS